MLFSASAVLLVGVCWVLCVRVDVRSHVLQQYLCVRVCWCCTYLRAHARPLLRLHFVLPCCCGSRRGTHRESWFTRLGALAPALESLGRVLGDIHSFQEETLLRPLEDTFYPVEDFVKAEVKKIRKVSGGCGGARVRHERWCLLRCVVLCCLYSKGKG